MQLLLVSIVVTMSANTYAQNSVNDLFNTYVIVPAQQRIQTLTDELNNVNTQILALQDLLANSTPTQVEQGSSPDDVIVPPVSPLVAQIADLQLRVTEIQNALTFWQTHLVALLAFNTQQQEQYLLANSEQIPTSTGETMATILSGQEDRLGPMPNPSNPWIVPVFVSTGDPQQDALLVQQWLFQHGLIDSIGQ